MNPNNKHVYCPYISEIKLVKDMPHLTGREQPTVAIITSRYCEKLAVDSMINDKTTFVKYKTESK